LTRMLAAKNVQDAVRAMQLTAKAGSHDREAAIELQQTATRLETDEAELQVRKADQDRIVAELAMEHAQLDAALADAAGALARIQMVEASQASFQAADARAAGRVQTGAAVCPVAGPVVFTNDWGAPRSGGRTHQGNDMFAAYGTPDVAVVAGWIEQNLDDLGGLGILLHGDDGNVYYYAHLSRFEGPNRRVVRGEVIGYVGDTGNAKGGPPHTHFEIRPGGGPAVNPYPTIRVLCPQ
jgi:peptidoglycan LD-endopeptidase LytH